MKKIKRRNTDSRPASQIRRQVNHCVFLLRKSKQASISYNCDVNTRFLGRGKTDPKRERLAKLSRLAFEKTIDAYEKLLGVGKYDVKEGVARSVSYFDPNNQSKRRSGLHRKQKKASK